MMLAHLVIGAHDSVALKTWFRPVDEVTLFAISVD